ncbi:hypothetical protein [Sphingobium nicotianae]|uniref:Uncharacterized protein n=1 Tax=Sphingobium nicotianae TaxID=2782607 RepID=A0A9X1DEE4_9SPHN|nr:hypothetical protein [Sphingobium nicotianae]MBT2188408.1 hypothetical protein [Sphingobium nicotianae]
MAIDPVRVTLVPRGADADTAAARQIILDLKLDTEKGTSSGPFPAFGRIGDFRKNETLFPFTLMMDGRLDMGAYASDAERQSKLDIRGAKLAVGGEVVLTDGDASETFVISAIAKLLD